VTQHRAGSQGRLKTYAPLGAVCVTHRHSLLPTVAERIQTRSVWARHRYRCVQQVAADVVVLWCCVFCPQASVKWGSGRAKWGIGGVKWGGGLGPYLRCENDSS